MITTHDSECYTPLNHPFISRLYVNANITETNVDGRIDYLTSAVLAGVLDRDYRADLAGLSASRGRVHVLNLLERLAVKFCADSTELQI